MRVRHEYKINQETLVVVPEYTTNGYLHTLLWSEKGMSRVDMSPYNLIDHNVRFHGSSLRGAIEGARVILGKVGMNPIIFNKELDIILFPSKSPFKEDCVWFSLQHVDGFASRGKHHTQVSLSNGSSITVNISKYAFEKKMQRACELRFRMQESRREFAGRVNELQAPYHLFKTEGRMNYEKDMQEQ